MMSSARSTKRRILIFSASFGGGHRSAAEALMRYLVAHHEDAVEVRIVDFFERFMPSVNMLAKFAYEQSVALVPDLYGTFFDVSNAVPSNPVVHELRIMGFQRAQAYIDDFCPDAVISTFPVAGGVVSDIKNERPMVSATVITDYGVHRTWLHPGTDLYFVASKEVREGSGRARHRLGPRRGLGDSRAREVLGTTHPGRVQAQSWESPTGSRFCSPRRRGSRPRCAISPRSLLPAGSRWLPRPVTTAGSNAAWTRSPRRRPV